MTDDLTPAERAVADRYVDQAIRLIETGMPFSLAIDLAARNATRALS